MEVKTVELFGPAGRVVVNEDQVEEYQSRGHLTKEEYDAKQAEADAKAAAEAEAAAAASTPAP